MIHGIQSGMNPQYLCLQNNFDVIPIASKYSTRYKNSKVELNVGYMQLPMLLALRTVEILHNFYIVKKKKASTLIQLFFPKTPQAFPID